MNKHDLVEIVAKRDEVSPSIAADHVDQAVTDIIRKLKKGGAVKLPGVGTLKCNGNHQIEMTQPPRAGKKR